MKEISPLYKNLIEMLEEKYQQEPQKIAYTFLTYSEAKKEEVNLTYADVYENAKAVAVHLKKHGIQAGDRVIIFSTQTCDNIYSIFGAIFAQAVFIIIPPPIDEGKKLRLKSVLESSKAKLILCNDTVADKLEESLLPKHIPRTVMRWIVKKIKNLEILSVESFKKHPELWSKPDVTEKSLAYLQYSSGSTCIPKGVKVTHGNVLNNIEALSLYFDDIIPKTIVAWAPFFHNMGLLSLVFVNLYINARSVILSPLAFVEDPVNWFRAVTEYKGDLIFAPNSAYDFCTRIIKEEDLNKLDLSTVKYAANGSEPISYNTLQDFYNKFKKCGFDYSAFSPGYGLAESTCFAAASRRSVKNITVAYERLKNNLISEVDYSHPSAKKLISLGSPFDGMEAIIVCPDTNLPSGENEIGELLLKSGSIAEGYWDMEEETNETFKVSVQGKDGFFMRTGDLAALYKGELYIAGRLKEIIIVNGHNIVPQDIELCLWENVPEIKGCVIPSFTISIGGKERIVTCIELPEKRIFNYSLLCSKINSNIFKILEVYPYDIVFVKDGSLPRTDNKKIQILSTKEAYNTNKLDALYSYKKGTGNTAANISVSKPEDAIEEDVKQILQSVIGSAVEIGTDENFFNLGGDSLTIVQLSSLLEEKYGIDIEIDEIVKNPTIKGISGFLKAHKSNNSPQNHQNRAELIYEDCKLDKTIVPESDQYCETSTCMNIFITGATGFIGAYLIKELMETTNATLSCLVRADSTLMGLERIKENMKYYKIWEECFETRLRPVIGDLSKPSLGVENNLYTKLCETIDSIYHSGAQLNFIYPYKYLRDSNVKGTVECLRLACKGKAKYFHYISTYSVYDNPSHFGKIVSEDDELSSGDGYFLPYSETKWVSEQLVKSAQNRGLKTAIYRPGEVCGSSDNGIWKLGDMVSRFLVSSINEGELPDIPMNIHITPVDYISKAIVQISMQENSIGKAFNLMNSYIKKLNELPELINAYGYRLRLVPFNEWKLKLANADSTNPLSSLKPLFLSDKTGEASFLDRYAAMEAKHDNKNVIASLTDKGILCPPVSEELLFKYLDYFLSMGYIKPVE